MTTKTIISIHFCVICKDPLKSHQILLCSICERIYDIMVKKNSILEDIITIVTNKIRKEYVIENAFYPKKDFDINVIKILKKFSKELNNIKNKT